ncbi:MAG: copper homeostasis protein CutC [Planctomycetota bacterium]
MAVPANARVPDAGRVLVEVAVDSLTGAEAAVAGGADRLELCACLQEGGLTPSLGLFEAVRAAVAVPVFVMLRPRPGDFLYDRGEFAAMQRDAAHFRRAGANGLVAGVLTSDGALDGPRLRELFALGDGLPCTCHRAFDLCRDPDAALTTLLDLGAARVLTSGQASSAALGSERIRRCVAIAGARLTVLAGAGVRDDNVAALVAATGVREVHLSATRWQPSGMTFRRESVPMGSASPSDEYQLRTTDPAMVARVRQALASMRG